MSAPPATTTTTTTTEGKKDPKKDDNKIPEINLDAFMNTRYFKAMIALPNPPKETAARKPDSKKAASVAASADGDNKSKPDGDKKDLPATTPTAKK